MLELSELSPWRIKKLSEWNLTFFCNTTIKIICLAEVSFCITFYILSKQSSRLCLSDFSRFQIDFLVVPVQSQGNNPVFYKMLGGCEIIHCGIL